MVYVVWYVVVVVVVLVYVVLAFVFVDCLNVVVMWVFLWL